MDGDAQALHKMRIELDRARTDAAHGTEQNPAAEAFQSSEQYARSIIECSLDMIIATDRERRIVEFNRSAEATFGYRREEVLGKHIHLLYADDQVGDYVHRTTFREGKIEGEIYNRRKNGELFHSYLSASLMHNSQGELMGIVGVSRDISQQKMIEQALQRSEKRFRCLIENSTEMITILDRRDTILYQSPSVEHALGYVPSDLEGKNIFELMHPEDAVAVAPIWLEHQLRPGPGPSVEFRFRHRDGSWRMLEARSNNLLDDIAVHGFVVNARDITSRKEMEQALRHLSTHDALTGVYNRAFFDRHLAEVQDEDYPLSIVVCDVDLLKARNDQHGHIAGDELLRTVGVVLSEAVRAGDIVARIGGDEFAAVLLRTNAQVAEQVVGRVRKGLVTINQTHREAPVHLSLGAATAFDSTEQLAAIKRADLQMYSEKQKRRKETKRMAHAQRSAPLRKVLRTVK